MYNNQLNPYEYKIYSQFGEDGIIAEIFSRIGTTNKFCAEFGGSYDGIIDMSNTANLLINKQWSGLLIEGDPKKCNTTLNIYKNLGVSTVNMINSFITKDNISSIFHDNQVPEELDFLSIDIDGNDYWVWGALYKFKPRVMMIEYNASFPPPTEWIMPYNPKHIWDKSNYQGASLESLLKLGQSLGYTLIGTEKMGCNAFFIRNDLLEKSGFNKLNARQAYHKPKYGTHTDGGHPPQSLLNVIKTSKSKPKKDHHKVSVRKFKKNHRIIRRQKSNINK